MGEAPLGFQPIRADRGESATVIVGSSGELVRIDEFGATLHQPVKPFPASVTGGAVLGGAWIGTWVEHELQQARMAALPLAGEWESGGGREMLRQKIEPADLMSSSAIWSRFLDAEPMAVSRAGDGVIFATLRKGIYKIDEGATEVWRAPYPAWSHLSGLASRDYLVSSNEVDGQIFVWSMAGGVTVLDSEDGRHILSTIVSLPDSLSDVRHSNEGGWLLLLNSGGIALLEDLESEPTVMLTPGPVSDAVHDGKFWKWTGWRHDGALIDGVVQCIARAQIGVALIGDRVLTNDGDWDDFGLNHSD
jgi:hypothetical protein